jgi:hypothetical protein
MTTTQNSVSGAPERRQLMRPKGHLNGRTNALIRANPVSGVFVLG